MTSRILPSGITMLGHGTTNGRTNEDLYDDVNSLDENDESNGIGLYKNSSSLKRQNGSNCHSSQSIVYDVPSSNECIYAQPKSNAAVSVENLIPSAARLILQQNPKTRSDILEQDRSDSEDYDYTLLEDSSADFNFEPRIPPPDYDYNNDDFKDSSYNDYGLEVIQEETESQMSSDSDQEFDSYSDFYPNSTHQRKQSNYKSKEPDHFGIHDFTDNPSPENIMGLSPNSATDGIHEESYSDEIITKHIRISPNWDPEPILKRLYAIIESKYVSQSSTPNEVTAGYLSILSGNRKKGTFWNAWKKKFYVAASGKLNVYEKEDCQELLQSINLIGGKVDFLDPTEFVGTEQGKTMTNRIIGVDDGKGHYFVLQCPTVKEAARWTSALIEETLSTMFFAIPILPRSPSLFKDIILVDFGSTNIRAGVLTHQPTLPALFFPAVMSENTETGRIIYGSEVYLTENRKNAKIKFPIESSSKMCQNTLDMLAVKGFLLKIFKDLNVKPENYKIIINLPRRVDGTCRKNLLQLLFKTFEVRSVLMCHQSIVSFWAYSADNGIICDIGERCDIVPVSQGFVLSHAWGRAPFGGQPLKHALRQGLGPQENGLYLSTPAENLVLRFISENFIYINGTGTRRMSQEAQEIVVEMDLRDVLSFSNLIGVNQNILRGVAEGFFDPGVYGLDCDSVQKILFKSLQDCGMDIRKEMSQNIFLTGGCTLIPGFAERLEFELTKLCPPHLKPKIQVSPYRYHASFIGASVLATTEAFDKSLLHKTKYDDGPGPSYWLI